MTARRSPHSIRQKLFAGMLFTTMLALLIFAAAIIVYDLRDYRERTLEDLATQSELIALTTAPALQFDDPALAAEGLRSLRVRPQILSAAIYNARGTLFATFSPDEGSPPFPALPEGAGHHISGSRVVSFHRIVENNEILGTVYIEARYLLYQRLQEYSAVVVCVMLIALVIAMLLALRLQRQVTGPVQGITSVARQVVEQRNFALRAEKITDDEIGYLAEAFNDLLCEVQTRSTALEVSNRELQAQIHEREQATEALAASERRHRTLLNALTAVVWTADADGGFDTNQPPWQAYTGQQPEQYRALGWLDSIQRSDRPRFEAAWSRARAERSELSCELQLWHAASQRHRYVRLNAVPLCDERGTLLEWIGTADDIDDNHRAAEQIHQLNADLENRVAVRTAELERANNELEAFSYSVSHDLRTPLRAIDGFSQALLEDYGAQLDDTAQDYLRRVRAGAQRMGRLIDDLLKLARVSRAEINAEVIDLSHIAGEILDELRAGEPERDVSVRMTTGLTAAGDPHLMRIVLENLLNNAWKYTGKRRHAEIEFGMRLQNGQPCFFVQDNGAGFDMTYSGKLFGAFQRLHDNKDYAGTGVGLATVQRIIHRHGGRIWAKAAVDEGAAFYFTLPMTRDHHNAYKTDSAG